MEWAPLWLQVLPVVFLLMLGLMVGGLNQYRHCRNLDRREKALAHMIVTNLKRIPDPHTVSQATLVTGDTVIASDYLKTFLTKLRALVGGEMRSMQKLLTRARREAVLRMLENAQQLGADEVWNVRLEFSSVTQMRGRRGAAAVEILAYGTAVIRR